MCLAIDLMDDLTTLRKFRISSESMLGFQGVSPSVVQMGTEVEEDEEERRHKPGREA